MLVRLLLFLAFLSSLTAHAQQNKKQTNINLSGTKVAVGDYDPVAYFTEHRAVEGSRSQAVVHEGATYYFSSVKNKEAFIASPAKYEPQYGGWCAFAMGATGEEVEVDPETFKIVNGKLFLFYNKFFNNTLKSWNKDEKNLKTQKRM